MFDVFYSGAKPNLFAHEQAVDTIEQAQQQSRTRFFWFVNYLSDYADFDFLWEPVPWQAHQRHAWPSQWQKSSGTYLVPKQGYTETHYRTETLVPRIGKIEGVWTVPDGADVSTFDWTWHPDDTEPPYIYQFGTQHQRTGGPQYCMPTATDTKYVDQIKIKTRKVATAIYEIDHMDGNAGRIPNTTRTVRYFDNYLDTLRRLAKSIPPEHEHVWICSSVCDYSNFDFSWHPEVWQATMLHVFASGSNKFGDTFYMHVPTFQHRVDQIELLDWYALNFIETSVPRRPMPVIEHHNDSHVDAVKNSSWSGPLATFTNTDYVTGDLVTVSLWRSETKTIVPLSPGATSVIVPRAAVGHIQTQLYDYAYIDRTHRLLKDEPLDIVFISNGETVADETFAHLQNVTGNLFREQRIHHVKGINGRVAAYHAAAEASSTPWFFAVFAKLFVDENFDWDWQPDRMQQPKHYIFHALNPVNGLEYGHQAMIAYNRQLVLNNPGHGLDFTLDDEHEVVPILSGTAVYNMSPWVAWRTAFREALKLKTSLPDVENEFRLTQWLSTNPGSQHIVNEEWSRWGAEDAVEYYNEVDGDFAALRKSYEWAWLASYAFVKRSLVPD